VNGDEQTQNHLPLTCWS